MLPKLDVRRGTSDGIISQHTSAKATVEQVYRQHNDSLIGFLRVRLQSTQDAREVAQEAYARILQRRGVKTIEFIRAYLFKTAAHIAADRMRRRETEGRFEAGLSQTVVELESPLETQMGAQQELEILDAALSGLSSKCQKVFLLRRVEDMRAEEVARQMGITERMVRLYVSQATSHCFRLLQMARSGSTAPAARESHACRRQNHGFMAQK